jgi:DNA-binding MarR family transcriptional regulator
VADARDLGDPGTAEFQVEKYPFYLLNRLVSRYNVVIESRLKAIGLDIPYWRVLMILGEQEPLSVGRISEAAVINLSTMTRIIQRMTAAGLVSPRPLPDDARVVEVSLTPAGKRKLAEARKETAPIYGQIIDGFSEEQFNSLIDSLDRLYRNLG